MKEMEIKGYGPKWKQRSSSTQIGVVIRHYKRQLFDSFGVLSSNEDSGNLRITIYLAPYYFEGIENNGRAAIKLLLAVELHPTTYTL